MKKAWYGPCAFTGITCLARRFSRELEDSGIEVPAGRLVPMFPSSMPWVRSPRTSQLQRHRAVRPWSVVTCSTRSTLVLLLMGPTSCAPEHHLQNCYLPSMLSPTCPGGDMSACPWSISPHSFHSDCGDISDTHLVLRAISLEATAPRSTIVPLGPLLHIEVDRDRELTHRSHSRSPRTIMYIWIKAFVRNKNETAHYFETGDSQQISVARNGYKGRPIRQVTSHRSVQTRVFASQP